MYPSGSDAILEKCRDHLMILLDVLRNLNGHDMCCHSEAEESVQLLWPLCATMVLGHGLGS